MNNLGNNNKKLTRSSDDKWIAGVCSGLAEYFGWDANVVRLLYMLLTIFTAFSGVLVYVVLWIIMPTK